jgi:hypothetical protein
LGDLARSRPRRLALSAGGGLAAYQATINPVDPGTVPPGFLAARGYIPFKVALQIGTAKPHVFTDGVQAYIQHGLIQPGQSTGWHSHARPVWVLMVKGTLTLYGGTDTTCTGHAYSAGQGIRGHRLRPYPHRAQRRHDAGRVLEGPRGRNAGR